MEDMTLGKCCICETENETVRNAITLDKKTPETEAKGGWGCFVCGLEPRGAVAVLCDECLDKWMNKQIEIKFACLGYPGENRRIEFEKLTEHFDHDLSKHAEENEMNFIETKTEQDIIQCQNCQRITAIIDGRCSTCGEEICLMCGCTNSAACVDGCEWVRPNVCSACDPLALSNFFIK